jgi:hypothetical protein
MKQDKSRSVLPVPSFPRLHSPIPRSLMALLSLLLPRHNRLVSYKSQNTIVEVVAILRSSTLPFSASPELSVGCRLDFCRTKSPGLPPSASTSRVTSRLVQRCSRTRSCVLDLTVPSYRMYAICMHLTVRRIEQRVKCCVFCETQAAPQCSLMGGGAETVHLRSDMYRTRSYYSSSNLYVSSLRLNESRHNVKAIPIRLQVDVLIVCTVSYTASPSSSFRDRAQ